MAFLIRLKACFSKAGRRCHSARQLLKYFPLSEVKEQLLCMQCHDYKNYAVSISNETFLGGKREKVNRDITYLNLSRFFSLYDFS